MCQTIAWFANYPHIPKITRHIVTSTVLTFATQRTVKAAAPLTWMNTTPFGLATIFLIHVASSFRVDALVVVPIKVVRQVSWAVGPLDV
jgi:hypothetical protein